MAPTNRERLDRALTLLRTGLATFVEDTLRADGATDPTIRARAYHAGGGLGATGHVAMWDVTALVGMMTGSQAWQDLFKERLSQSTKSYLFEAREWRNKWAHQAVVNGDDTERALDTIERILSEVGAIEADQVEQMRTELRRLRVSEEVRGQARRAGGTPVQVAVAGNLTPWREVVVPHPDVANGKFELAEFAADLWQVHLGQATTEYQDPKEFFGRTFMTEGLRKLLASVTERLAGTGGHPVINLKTNFGGGKTHAMLAAYHLCSGVPTRDLPGVAEALADSAVQTSVPPAKRAVLVGTKISAGNPSVKPDGTVVRTLWGELAWQLGGAPAFAKVAEDDANATSPGDTLKELFDEYGPCLILVDEWVAYARQLPDRDGQKALVGGAFETQFSFAQALTESARAAKACALLVSLPASDGAMTVSGEVVERVDDVEVGGVRGRTALARIGNVVGRIAEDWKPASADESFEIVRRRLFEPVAADRINARTLTCRAFAEAYRADTNDTFPPGCREGDYERRLIAAYPIHPEVFDRLYADWSTLVKFQRTRGVLRLMATVIHCLWRDNDRNPVIMPALIPVDDTRVRNELTRYLEDGWTPIIVSDVDGPTSLPAQVDAEDPRLGAAMAARRVARTIYLGSAPSTTADQRGIEVRRINLGTMLPGEAPGVFADALRRLETRSSYLFRDEARYWFSTRPNLNSLASDRSNQIGRDPDKVRDEIRSRVRNGLGPPGQFARVHAFPAAPGDVPDETEVRLVVLGPEVPHLRNTQSEAMKEARRILASKGASQRIYQNTLVFLAPDKTRLDDLERSVAVHLAWVSVLKDSVSLVLDPQQVRQAEEQRAQTDKAVVRLVPEVFSWVIAPEQASPLDPIDFACHLLAGAGDLANRVSTRLERDAALVPVLGGSVLRGKIDAIPLWASTPGNDARKDVSVDQLVKHFASYVYLDRLTKPAVLLRAIEAATRAPAWETDGLAYAAGYDETGKRYQALRLNETIELDRTMLGMVVRPDVALAQYRATPPAPVAAVDPLGGDGWTGTSGTTVGTPGSGGTGVTSGGAPETGSGEVKPPVGIAKPAPKKRRYHGSVTINPARPIPDASKVAEEVIALLHSSGAKVRVTIEIEAEFPDGAPDRIVRAVLENGRALRFDDSGFEES